ncbi:MAG: prolyl oligopeptidase family serine peptidase [Verrucomicrobia bacterium]|nr:prolyl oligopeptidase family serine peptidase [Verrucomicrobiota bacterium]
MRFTLGEASPSFTAGSWRLAAALVFALLPFHAFAIAPPRASAKPVVATYHGTQVSEDYQWLENGDSPETRRWTQGQNEAARALLDKLPTRSALAADLTGWVNSISADYHDLKLRGGLVFALKFQPPAQQPVLVTRPGVDAAASERVVLDPVGLDPKAGLSIDFYEPSFDGRYVAVSLSAEGSEAGTLRVIDVASGKAMSDVVPRAQYPTAGGSVAWQPGGAGFYYTRYPDPADHPGREQYFHQQVYFHALGTRAAEDRYETGKEFPRIAEIVLRARPQGGYVLASVANGDGGDVAHWLREPSGNWRQIARFEDGVKQVEFAKDPPYIEWPRDEALYLLSTRKASRGRLLRLPLASTQLSDAQEASPEGRRPIERFLVSVGGFYLAEQDGGPMVVRFRDRLAQREEAEAVASTNAASAGTNRPPSGVSTNTAPASAARDEERPTRREWRLPLQALHAVDEMICERGDELLLRTEGFVESPSWLSYDPRKDAGRLVATGLRATNAVDFSDIDVHRAMVRSKDGTEVPLTLLARKGLRREGRSPTILTGYGGYGISEAPRFQFHRRAWFDQGGIVAVGNMRGGGEYGEAWHRGGNLTRKQNVFDDFIACAEWLVRSNYTRADSLAIEGGSNGGLLMGAALTQRPDLFRAVVAHVGIFDMLRVELDPNGEFNTTEFGAVGSAAQFEALLGYSPYHHVRDGVAYPSVLFLTGERDGRVNPAHSRKMTARLQAASASRGPVLLRTSAHSGHGMGTSLDERVAQQVDVYSYLFSQLRVDYSSVARGPWSGNVTPTSATVKARLQRDGLRSRLKLSERPSLEAARIFSADAASSNRHEVVEYDLKGLHPDTQYYYGLEIEGKLDVKTGSFRTFPADAPASFSFAYASCARTASTSDVFDAIRENHPLFYMNVGDWHYLDITNNEAARFRAAYDLVLSSPQQSDLYRSAAFVYMWDDHDFGGNNSSRSATSHKAARLAYDEYVPHYPLAAGRGDVPIYQSFNVGRVKFILTDLRSERDAVTNRDDSSKSMMGAAQKQWFKQELLSANGRFPLIFWVSTVPWLGEKGSNYYRIGTNVFGYIHHTQITNSPTQRTNRNRAAAAAADPNGEDHWSVFATERREIADFIQSNHIRGVAILHGDSHMLAADDGRNSDYSTLGGARLPVMCAAPLDQSPSIKGGPYSQGVYRMHTGESGFGWIDVTDLGHEIEVRFSGRNNKNEEKIALRFSTPSDTSGWELSRRRSLTKGTPP